LAGAAIAQADDQGPKGGESHIGSDGSRPAERMRAIGVQTSEYAEVISVGYATAPGVVEQLLVDQPGPNHPHGPANTTARSPEKKRLPSCATVESP